jgi:preprotein translocase subunit SecF
MELLKNPNFDFLGKTRICVPLSLVIVAGSIALMASEGGLRYGVEFSGGTQLIVKLTSSPEIDRVRSAVESVSPGAVIQTFDDPAKNQVLIRISGVEDEAEEGGEELGARADRALAALAEGYAENPVLESSSEIVGPIVGAELRRKAVQLTVLALAFQLIYIGIRFKGPVWGAGATMAVFHDVFVTLGCLSLLGYEITLNVIAALLTIVGYSVNDTIVIFDRARENLRQRRKEPLDKIVNESINQTLSRTLITSSTTFFAVCALYVFGGEVLRGFAFTMVVGVVVGTYSTIYVASPLVVWWRGRAQRRLAASG